MTATLFPGSLRNGLNTLTTDERHALVHGCEGTCRKLAKEAARYAALDNHLEDLISDARLACVAASQKWEPERGTKFNTFATGYIRKALMKAVDLIRDPGIQLESWDTITDPEGEGFDGYIDAPDEEEERLLKTLNEPTRTAVRLVVFGGITPDRAAVQLGVEVKDLKLMLRNAATTIQQAKDGLAKPCLFPNAGQG